MKGGAGLSAGRRWLFGAVLLLGVVGTIEVSSWAVFRIVARQPFSREALREQRDVIVGDSGQSRLPGRNLLPDFVANKALHPYVGYVYDVPPESEREGSSISRFGYVDDTDPILQRSDDRLIVGILGGSVAMNLGRSSSAIDLLERHLAASERFAGRSIEWVNIGLSGYHQPQQLMTVAYLLSLGAEFDLLINLDGFNEVALHPVENGPSGVFPAYPRTWNLRVTDLPQSVAVDYAEARGLQRVVARGFSAGPLKASVTSNVIWWLLNRTLAGNVHATQEAVRVQARARRSFAATGPVRSYANLDEMEEDLVAIWQSASLQLSRLAAANGILYYQFLQPNQYVADSKIMGAEEHARAIDPASLFREPVEVAYPLLRRGGNAMRLEGVRFTDLTMVFERYETPFYIDDCCHFNAEGYEVVAEAIADAILADDGESIAARGISSGGGSR